MLWLSCRAALVGTCYLLYLFLLLRRFIQLLVYLNKYQKHHHVRVMCCFVTKC